jgi:hypothetical protein
VGLCRPPTNAPGVAGGLLAGSAVGAGTARTAVAAAVLAVGDRIDWALLELPDGYLTPAPAARATAAPPLAP